jgi:hypothetical protein
MRVLLSAVIVSITAAVPIAAQAPTRPSNPVKLRILSADTTRPVTAHVRLSGAALYSLGATRVPGQVNLSGDTGSVTTPAVVEVSNAPGHIIFETSSSDPEVVLAAASRSAESRLYARGHSVEVVRDSSGHLRLITPTRQNR